MRAKNSAAPLAKSLGGSHRRNIEVSERDAGWLTRGDISLSAPIRKGAERAGRNAPADDLAAARARVRFLHHGKPGSDEGLLHVRRHAFLALDAGRLLHYVFWLGAGHDR